KWVRHNFVHFTSHHGWASRRDYVLTASALPTGGRCLGRCAPCERRRRQLHRRSRLMREEERGLGELELEQTRLPCGVANQVDARVKELPVGQRREGAVRHGTLVGPGLAPGDRLGREQPVGRRRPERSEEHTSELQSPCNLVCRLL